MDEWLWWGLQVLGLVLAFALLAFIWEKLRNAVSARVGIGRFYNRLPRSDTSREQLIANMEMLGDYLLNHAVEHMKHDSAVDWEWRLGEDLKRMAGLARGISAT